MVMLLWFFLFLFLVFFPASPSLWPLHHNPVKNSLRGKKHCIEEMSPLLLMTPVKIGDAVTQCPVWAWLPAACRSPPPWVPTGGPMAEVV